MKAKLLIVFVCFFLCACEGVNEKLFFPWNTFDASFPKKNIDLSDLLGDEVSIKRGTDTITLSIFSTENENLIRNKTSGDTLFLGKVAKFRGIWYFNQQMNDTAWWIYAVKQSGNLLYGLNCMYEQLFYIDEQVKAGYCSFILKSMDTARCSIRLHADKREIKKIFSDYIETTVPDTILNSIVRRTVADDEKKPAPAVESSEKTEVVSRVYPNPAASYINIELLTAGSYSFLLYDLSGKVSIKGKLEKERETLDISSLSAGLYTLSVLSSSGNLCQTIKVSKIDR